MSAYSDFKTALADAYVAASGPFKDITVKDPVTGVLVIVSDADGELQTAGAQEEKVEAGIKSLTQGDDVDGGGIADAIRDYVEALLAEHKEDDH